jgi:hypothetical protein
VPTTYNVAMPYQQPTNTGQYSQTEAYDQAAHPHPQPVVYPTFNNSGDGDPSQQPQTFHTLPGVTNVQPPYGYS